MKHIIDKELEKERIRYEFLNISWTHDSFMTETFLNCHTLKYYLRFLSTNLLHKVFDKLFLKLKSHLCQTFESSTSEILDISAFSWSILYSLSSSFISTKWLIQWLFKKSYFWNFDNKWFTVRFLHFRCSCTWFEISYLAKTKIPQPRGTRFGIYQMLHPENIYPRYYHWHWIYLYKI